MELGIVNFDRCITNTYFHKTKYDGVYITVEINLQGDEYDLHNLVSHIACIWVVWLLPNDPNQRPIIKVCIGYVDDGRDIPGMYATSYNYWFDVTEYPVIIPERLVGEDDTTDDEERPLTEIPSKFLNNPHWLKLGDYIEAAGKLIAEAQHEK